MRDLLLRLLGKLAGHPMERSSSTCSANCGTGPRTR